LQNLNKSFKLKLKLTYTQGNVMNLWLKFMGYVVGSFLAVWVYMHFNPHYPQNQQDQPQPMVLQQTVPTDPPVDTSLPCRRRGPECLSPHKASTQHFL